MPKMSLCGRRQLVFLKLFFLCATPFSCYHWLYNIGYLVTGRHGNLTNNNATILLWHWPFGSPFRLNPDMCLQYHSVQGCLLTTNRLLFPKADFVVFHNFELWRGKEKLPLQLARPANQKWVWLSLESPENNGNLQPLAGHFNYVMTYKRDADIPIPYGKLVPQEGTEGSASEPQIPRNKSSLACWVVSNYSNKHKRTDMYKKLRKVIQVTGYGKAFGKPLSKEALLPTISRCYFYLAFENSVFQDYITEKFWYNGLMGGAVPVVLGPPRADYEAVAPNNSFIHVDDFSSVKELGKFLKYLAGDEKRYATYFAWKQKFSVKLYRDWRERLCAMCPKISTLKPQIYKDLLTLF